MNPPPAGSLEPAPKKMDLDITDGTGVINNQGNLNDDRDVNKSDTQSQFKHSVIDFNNKYKVSDKGPFYVFVEHTDKNLGKLFPMRVGYYLRLNNEFRKSILDIKVVGKNRVKVIVDSFSAANQMINNELLTKNGLIAYIPKFYTQKKGLIRMVDTFFSDEFLLGHIESEKKVLEIKRLERKVIDNEGKEKIVKRQLVVLSFQGNSIPQCVRINGVNFPVEPYIHPVVQCRVCLRYGHISKLCKNTETCCKKCGEVHKENECDDVVRCIYCKTSDHPTISRQCPVYLKQRRIKERMAMQNLSFKEAEAIENNPSYAKVATNNRFQILNNLENFPSLPNTKTSHQATFSKPKHSQANNTPNPNNGSSHNQKNTHKKRKAARSPAPSSPLIGNPPILAIPNPYAQEFRDYKQKLVDRLLPFLENLFSRTSGDNNLFSNSIKDTLNELLADVDNTASRECDNDGSVSDDSDSEPNRFSVTATIH